MTCVIICHRAAFLSCFCFEVWELLPTLGCRKMGFLLSFHVLQQILVKNFHTRKRGRTMFVFDCLGINKNMNDKLSFLRMHKNTGFTELFPLTFNWNWKSINDDIKLTLFWRQRVLFFCVRFLEFRRIKILHLRAIRKFVWLELLLYR